MGGGSWSPSPGDDPGGALAGGMPPLAPHLRSAGTGIKAFDDSLDRLAFTRRPTWTNGRATMDLTIRAPDEAAIADAYGFDDSFLVESELALSAEGGVVRYEVVSVPPYRKCYGRLAGDDLSARLKDPDKAV